MSITFNKHLAGQHIHVTELDTAYQCDNFKITVYKKGGCIISDINNEEISLHAELCVLIGAFYDSYISSIEDIFAFYNNDGYHKEMTENKNILLLNGCIFFIYKDKEYELDLNKIVVSSEVFCAASQAEINEVLENV